MLRRWSYGFIPWRNVCLFAKLGLNCLAFGFVAWLVEEGKHVFLVSLHTWLVEWVHAQDVATHATSLLEEIDELAEVALSECRNGDEQSRNTAEYFSERNERAPV